MSLLKPLESIPILGGGVKWFDTQMHGSLFQHSVFGAIVFLVVSNTEVYKHVKGAIFDVTGYRADGNTMHLVHAVVFAVIMYFGSLFILAPLLTEGGPNGDEGKKGKHHNPCKGINCLNGGSCVGGVCQCVGGWYGARCGKSQRSSGGSDSVTESVINGLEVATIGARLGASAGDTGLSDQRVKYYIDGEGQYRPRGPLIERSTLLDWLGLSGSTGFNDLTNELDAGQIGVGAQTEAYKVKMSMTMTVHETNRTEMERLVTDMSDQSMDLSGSSSQGGAMETLRISSYLTTAERAAFENNDYTGRDYDRITQVGSQGGAPARVIIEAIRGDPKLGLVARSQQFKELIWAICYNNDNEIYFQSARSGPSGGKIGGETGHGTKTERK